MGTKANRRPLAETIALRVIKNCGLEEAISEVVLEEKNVTTDIVTHVSNISPAQLGIIIAHAAGRATPNRARMEEFLPVTAEGASGLDTLRALAEAAIKAEIAQYTRMNRHAAIIVSVTQVERQLPGRRPKEVAMLPLVTKEIQRQRPPKGIRSFIIAHLTRLKHDSVVRMGGST